VRKTLDYLKRGLYETLLAEEKQTESKSEYSSEAVLKVFLLLLKQYLSNAFSGILVTRSTKYQSY
jgi:alpha-D-ribose 1-methylphosphonate 5-triphosphate synthase subunit PhnI